MCYRYAHSVDFADFCRGARTLLILCRGAEEPNPALDVRYFASLPPPSHFAYALRDHSFFSPQMSRSGPLGLDRRGDSTSTDPLALYDVPSGLLELYDKIGVGGTLSCDHQLDEGDGYTTNGAGKDGTHYCGDASSSPSYVYWCATAVEGATTCSELT